MARVLKAELEEMLKETIKVKEELENQVQKLKNENDELRLELNKVKESLESANKCADTLAHRCDEYSKQVNKLELDNSKLTFSIDEVKASCELAMQTSDMFANRCEEYSKDIQKLKSENKKLKEVQKLKDERKHNERNAGRKPKLTSEEIARAQMLRLQGWNYKKIAEDIGCSVGLIHKLINESTGNIKKRD